MAPKSKKKEKKVKKIVDTEQYFIEKIKGNKIDGFTIYYEMRWDGYGPEWDTAEAEWRMNCDEKLIEFAKTLIFPASYVDKIPKIMENMYEMLKDRELLKGVLDPLSILAQTTVHCGSVKFVDIDTVQSKMMFLEFIRDTNQHHLLHSAHIPTEEEIENDSNRYFRELRYRLAVFPEHPLVKIIFPLKTNTVFYSPPPLSSLLFEPITMEMFKNNEDLEHLIVPSSVDTGFNRSQVFINSEYFARNTYDNPRYFAQYAQNRRKKLYDGMKRIDYTTDPRFFAHLEITQDVGCGWTLQAAHDVDLDTPLFMMTGVISPVEMAHKSLIAQGERIAFSSFVEIPNTEMCLDRRLFHDFSKYIPHSCFPTCSVRLVNSGNEYPDLVVYSKTPLNKKNGREISLDWYGGFTKDVQKYFRANEHPDGRIFHLYEKKMDFVQCLCDHLQCREVLYIDRSTMLENPNARKIEKLESLDDNFKFRGLSVAEPKKIWDIHNGLFTE